ncbi:protein TIFY 10B-like isoform X2 [Quercus robur]|uniref:protein TIFY 10B-like isoform X2 n=1 Tax=Quercus robur TaxID=38942 RepID=UPI002163EACE|nr:protein TIFY 10B-like isoform X2 [Quercus robur]
MLKHSKAQEKSNFAQTCNLLSQYMKEKGSLSLEMTRKPEPKENPQTPVATTMDLLTNLENSGEALRQNAVAPASNVQPMDFLQKLGVCPSNPTEMATNKADSRKPATMEAVTAQMTIFYRGQVLVFDDLPAEKAREIITVATKGSSSVSNGFVSTPASIMEKVRSRSPMASESNVVAAYERNTTTKERVQQQPRAIGSDLPIARRASLHRFFEKRKDRAAANAPYQVNPSSPAAPKPEESIPWIKVGVQSSNQLELKL